MRATTPAASPADGQLPMFTDVVRSEFCKLRTVRSTFWTLLAAVGFNVVTAALLGIILPGHLGARQQATIDSTRLSLGGLHLSQVAIGLLGVLAVSSEYSTGMIRATLAAVPQRRLMLTAKALVLTAAALVTGLAASFAAYLVFQAFLPAGDAMRTTLATPGVLRAVTGAGLYLAVLGLLGFGLAAISRSSAGAVAVLLGALFVPSLLAALLPQSWQDTIGPYLPLNAGESAYTVQRQAHALSPWVGLGVFCLYAAAALAAGFVLISRRDA
jgi:ABC-2 type transport system permease protein